MTELNETPDLATDDAEDTERYGRREDADDTQGHGRREDADDTQGHHIR